MREEKEEKEEKEKKKEEKIGGEGETVLGYR